MVNFSNLHRELITCGEVVGDFHTHAQYGDAKRGGIISFHIKVRNRNGDMKLGKVVVYSCMKELWRTSLGFEKFQDFNPTDTLNGINQRLKKYKEFIDIIISKVFSYMGEDTRIEVTFNKMSITEAFDIFVIRDMKSIVTIDLDMLRIDSVELFEQMAKFHDMAKADNRFSGNGGNK